MRSLKEFWMQLSAGVDVEDSVMISHDNLGIPRSEMPQITRACFRNFVTYLMNNNILVRSIPNYPIGMVRFTQEDVSLSKVRDMISKFEGSEKDASDNPFLVALDGYLLDGHHRYLAKVFDGTCLTVPVIMVSMEIRELIEFAHCYLDGVEDAQS